MLLSSGQRLGPYEILSPLGAGGMGEVYRAKDTRLDRTVAIKVLPMHLTDDAGRRQRLEREARAVSSLNHPHICTLYDIGHQDGTDYLVMEYLEGETLAQRLEKGPLPPDQVLRYAIEIADALDKAHRQGVVHRDLKPGNIMLTKSGAKLLDFGLAKAIASGVAEVTAAATLGRPLTAEGTIVGTFQYMAPEQLEGKNADSRSDIFAFGAVLHEAATGKKAFAGKSQASVIAAILERDPPPISSLQPMAPPALDRVVKICLAKDPDDRWQTAHDLKLQFRWIAEGGSQAGIPAPLAVRRKSWEQLAWILASLALLLLLTSLTFYLRKPTTNMAPVRSSILPPEKGAFVFLGPNGPAALSPDGRSVAFVAHVEGVARLWVRSLDSFTPQPLAGTEDAYFPFWSPDSRNLGFFAQGKLKRISSAGGPAITLCDVEQGRGGSWNSQDVILFAKYPGEVYRIPSSGGSPQKVTKFDPTRQDLSHRWPFFLPDGNHFLYLASAFGSASEDNVFYVGSLDGKVNRILFRGSSIIAYAGGYLLYAVDRTLMARPFDTQKLDFTGEAVPVAEGLQYDAVYSNAVFSASQNGLLLYQTGMSSSARNMNLLDTAGKRLGSLGDPASYYWPQISPDGRFVAYTLIDTLTGKADIWIQNIASGSRTRLTVDPSRAVSPVWSHDGSNVAYSSTRSGKPVVYVKPANGMGEERKLWEPPLAASVCDWTTDSKSLVLMERAAGSGRFRFVLLPSDGTSKPSILLEVQGADVQFAQLSRDARWIAYQSNESGKFEIYVSPFPNPVGKLQVSLAGGHLPRWRRDGKELYYLTPEGKLEAAALTDTSGSLQVLSRRTLFQANATQFQDTFDVFPDGKKFLLDTMTTDETPAPLSLVVNWTAELKK